MNKLLPPKYFNTLVFLAIAFHFIFPIKIIIFAPYSYIGVGIILLSLGMNIWSTTALEKVHTTADFHAVSQRLVVTGPFRFSRNPIYLSGITLLIGLAILLGSVITFAFPLILLLIINQFYIPDEEKRLTAIFGEEYLNYKRRVRRWI